MTEKEIERLKKHIGRPPKFPTAKDLFEAALGYFKECDENPMHIHVRDKKSARASTKDDVKNIDRHTEEVPRPYTLDGLCLYCGIFSPWATFKQHCRERKDWEDFRIVINACEQTIRNQQVAGAFIGQYSERLVARLNGITDKTEVDVTAKQTSITFEEYVKMLRGEGVIENGEEDGKR